MRMVAESTWPVDLAKEYILARVHADQNGCWIWQKAACREGYGRASVPKTFRIVRPWISAHRVSYMVFIGDIHAGLFVCHRCDVPACCNPEHLWLGTAADNAADMYAKGRAAYERASPERKRAKRAQEYARMKADPERLSKEQQSRRDYYDKRKAARLAGTPTQ